MSTTITIRFNRKLIVLWSSIVAAVLVGWLALSPYFVVWRLQSAAESQNADGLAALVDFESVRSSLKEFLYSQWLDSAGDNQDGFAALGSTLGLMLVDSLIDRFVTPHGFAVLMRNPERGLDTGEPEPPDDVIDDISTSGTETRKAYESPNRFVFETWSTGMDEQRVGFVLKRKGLSWRVTGLRLPLPPPEDALASEPTTRPEAEPGYWHVDESADPIDDSVTITAIVSANGQPSFGTGPTLAVRCAKDKTEAFINWSHYLGRDHTGSVVVRWNDGVPETERWSGSTSHRSTFARQPIGFVRSLMEHDRLVVRTTPYNDAPATLVFDLTSDSKRGALWRVADACNWNPADQAIADPTPRYVTPEQLANVKVGMTETEVEGLLGKVVPSYVRTFRDEGVTAWFYAKDPERHGVGSAVGVFFRSSDRKVYRTDPNAVEGRR